MENDDLSSQLQCLEQTMDGMVDRVQRNEQVMRRVQDFEMDMLSLHSLRELIEYIHDQTRQAFNLHSLSLVVADKTGDVHQCLVEDGFDFEQYPSLLLLKETHLFRSTLGLSQRVLLGQAENVIPHEFWQHDNPFPKAGASIPLVRRGAYLGCLVLGSDDATRFQQGMATYFLERLGKVLSVCLESTLNFEQLRRSSLYDTLTGTNNRRFFDQRIEEEIIRSSRTGEPLSCLFIDIDHFKQVNDTHGHQVGDMALRFVSKQLRSQLRSNDILARYGGEEFVVLLPTAVESKGIEVAERMRDCIEQSAIDINKSKALNLTVSIGVSTFTVDHSSKGGVVDKAVLMECADKALYAAKNGGRNCVKSGGEIKAETPLKETSIKLA